MNITALLIDYNEKSGEQSNQIHQFVAAGLLHIIGYYFSKWSSYFVLTLCCRHDYSCYFYNDMFYKIFAEWNEWPLQIVVVNRNEYIKVLGERQYNMIFTDSYDAFVETEIHSYTADYNYNEYYYIFLKTHDHLIPSEMQKIFEYCWQYYLINCIIQIQNRNGDVLFYTYYPFTASHCGKVKPVLINEFNGTSLLNTELFPKKMTNLYGCPLKAALWHVPPYLFLSTDAHNLTYISGGFEGKLLLELARKLNFTLDIKIPENNSQRGVILTNGSLTGALKMLKERQADISMGIFRQNSQRSKVATSTMDYYQTPMQMVALSDSYLLNSLDTLFFPFTKGSWYLLFAVNFLALGIVAILRRCVYHTNLPKEADHGTLNVLLMLLGMPAVYRSEQNISRILSISWMMYALLIRTMYNALLFHMIRTRINNPIPQTLEQLVHNNYSMVVNIQNAAALEEISLLKSLKIIYLNSTSDPIPLQYLEKLSIAEAKTVVAPIPLAFVQYYTKSFHKAGLYKVLPKNIMNFKCCMYLTKHSFLINQLDDILVGMQGFGLIEAWSHRVLDKHYYNSQHLQADRIFGLQQLYMAFVIGLGGFVVATLVFILEFSYKQYQYRKFILK